MDPTSVLALSSVFASTVKVAEKTFEICAVDSQAKAVLATINQCSSQLNSARMLRRQKSTLLSKIEKQMIDNTFKHTEDAIKDVASLAERARTDISIAGKVRTNTRLLYVLRDGPNIHIGLTKLSIASQSLNMALFMLMGREGRSASLPTVGTTYQKDLDIKPPPTYEASTFYSEARRKNMMRRENAQPQSHYQLHRSHSSSSLPPYTALPPENDLHRTKTEPVLPSDAKDIPKIMVSELAAIEEDIDFELLQQATFFAPPPCTTSPRASPLKMPMEHDFIEFAGSADKSASASATWPMGHRIMVPRINEADTQDFAGLVPPAQSRRRSWSGTAGFQADELWF